MVKILKRGQAKYERKEKKGNGEQKGEKIRRRVVKN